MLVPIGRIYTTTRTGSIIKLVRCVHCESEFVYLVQRTAIGAGVSPLGAINERAQQVAGEVADSSLGLKLQTAFDVVPCVHCKMYQPEMIARMRNRRFMWLWIAGLAIVVISSLVILSIFSRSRLDGASPPSLRTMLIFPASGAAMILVWFALRPTFDPNARSDERKAALCTSPAMTREQFDTRMTENAKLGSGSFDPSTLFLKRMNPALLEGIQRG